MEALVIAIMLIAALAIGVENKQRSDHATHASCSTASPIAPVSKTQSVDSERPVDLCDPDHPHMIQRDLTVPLDHQSPDDEH